MWLWLHTLWMPLTGPIDQMNFWMCDWLTDWPTNRLADCHLWQMKNAHVITLDFHLQLSAILIYDCSSVCPLSNLLSVHWSIHPPKGSIHPSVHTVSCRHASTHLSLHFFICPFVCVHTFLMFVSVYLHALGLSLKWNLTWSALLFTETRQQSSINAELQ